MKARPEGQYWDQSWNVTSGCTKCSPGCASCHAERNHTKRHKASNAGKLQNVPQYAKPFSAIQLHTDRLDYPLHWREPRTVFVCLQSDLFHESVPDEFIDRVYAAMALAPRHTYLILTKRVDRMAEYHRHLAERVQEWDNGEGETEEYLITQTVDSDNYNPSLYDACCDWLDKWNARHLGWPLPNVLHGATVCNQQEANEKIPHLLQIPGRHWLSIEPMLGGIDLEEWLGEWACENGSGSCGHFIYPIPCEDGCDYGEDCAGTCPECGCHVAIDAPYDHGRQIDFVTCGGESGKDARPAHPQWFRDLRDQCQSAGVPFFLKSNGEFLPINETNLRNYHASDVVSVDGLNMYRVRHKAAGRLLDGRTWDELPEVSQ